MKILTIVGARPQFVKAAVVSRALRGQPGIHEILVHTGQHFDANMSQVFFDEMAIPQPDYNLGIGGGTHGQNTGRMIEQIEAVLLKENPQKSTVCGLQSAVSPCPRSSVISLPSSVSLTNPVGYLEMIWLLERCSLVMTDSGGLQKEAYFFQKPCITLRDETEWVELVEAGANTLAGADTDAILSAFAQSRNTTITTADLYGNGQSARQIVRSLHLECGDPAPL